MITKKLNLKTKLKQFIFIILICCNEINFELTKINSDYYNYATFTRNNKTTESSSSSTSTLLQTTNLTISHDAAVEQDSEVYFLKNICSTDLNKKDSTYDNCLITLMPCVSGFTKSFSKNFTDFLLPSSFSCDFMEVTVYEPSTKYLTRKTITRKQYRQFKSAYMNDFKYRSVSFAQPQLNSSSQSSFAQKTVLSPNGASSDKLKLIYNIETDRIQDVNTMFRKYLNSAHSDDHLVTMSLIQDKYTYNFFLHLKAKSGKTYMNQLFPDSSLSNNNFYFRFKKPNTFLLRLKSVEYFNIIRYEIYTPITPLCAVDLNNTRQQAIDTKHDYLPSDFLNCDNFDELAFYQEVQQRGNYCYNFRNFFSYSTRQNKPSSVLEQNRTRTGTIKK